MKTFHEFLIEKDFQFDEGPIWDKMKSYGTAAVVGAGMMGAGMNYMNQEPELQSSSWTSPAAAQFVQPEAQPQQVAPQSRFDKAFKNKNTDLKRKAEILKQNKMNQGTFSQGNLNR
jgi:hypothetical protein